MSSCPYPCSQYPRQGLYLWKARGGRGLLACHDSDITSSKPSQSPSLLSDNAHDRVDRMALKPSQCPRGRIWWARRCQCAAPRLGVRAWLKSSRETPRPCLRCRASGPRRLCPITWEYSIAGDVLIRARRKNGEDGDGTPAQLS
jgi:hypothetical protein